MALTFDVPGYGWGGGSEAPIGVSDLTAHLTSLIRHDEILQDLWIRGEISNCTRAASGHLYFTLKDEFACVSCVMWRTHAGRAPLRPQPGLQVVAHGMLDIYAPRGQYQLVVDELRPEGAGSLHMLLEQAKARLLAEGLLDPERKRPLPEFPRRIAVVTSLSGAAIRDICAVLGAAAHPPEIVLVPALCQGEEAVPSLCRALELANERTGADVIIIGRGGGSLEDLWCFNAESLARAIAASRTPVISAVGHETDFTLSDLAADARAATPTHAAEMILLSRDDLIRRAELATRDALLHFSARVETARLRLDGILARLPLSRPEWLVQTRRQRLDEVQQRLLRARELTLTRWQHRLALAAGRLEGVSPLATLARGYAAIHRMPGGEPVRSVRDAEVGDSARVSLSDGDLIVRVEQIRRLSGEAKDE